ncbi:Crp/Fnr family transcriptional regulator [Mesorhizobium sp.]|uniref:Crp/Fnr family transcriptional regulator n=1 Tax=Mesorhizobium sp. TaxID=1871066 RepID=UPI000FE876EC|nr:Crp/Fnr family transcriptional regulator [Mesorhizobium sp.]RWP61382.1 MAG: Crp/Fnr family transcriptional regulator [Mesorhizobium sp.]
MTDLDAIPVLETLDADTRARISQRCRRMSVDANQMIIDFEDPSTDVYFLVSGRVRILYRSPVGKEVILGELGAGGCFGELAAIDGRPRAANVTALHRSELVVMPAPFFSGLLHDNPAFALHFLAFLAERIRSLNTRLAEYSFLQVRPRLLCELLRLSRLRSGSSGERIITPPPLQNDLAARIGSRREVVSRELSALVRDGLVAKARGALVLTNPAELNRRISVAMNA